jgi:hypothetical protein
LRHIRFSATHMVSEAASFLPSPGSATAAVTAPCLAAAISLHTSRRGWQCQVLHSGRRARTNAVLTSPSKERCFVVFGNATPLPLSAAAPLLTSAHAPRSLFVGLCHRRVLPPLSSTPLFSQEVSVCTAGGAEGSSKTIIPAGVQDPPRSRALVGDLMPCRAQ